MRLTREQIEEMRGVLRRYWTGAGHSPEAPEALCDMALSTLSETTERDRVRAPNEISAMSPDMRRVLEERRNNKLDISKENAAANAEALKTAEEIIAGDRIGIHVREVGLARALLRFEKMNALYRELLKTKAPHSASVAPQMTELWAHVRTRAEGSDWDRETETLPQWAWRKLNPEVKA